MVKNRFWDRLLSKSTSPSATDQDQQAASDHIHEPAAGYSGLALQKVYLALYEAQQQHGFIDIQRDNDTSVYQSMMLSLDPGQRTIMIDKISPRAEWPVGQCVTVSVRQTEGRRMKFNSVVVDTLASGHGDFMLLAMPQTLQDEQRRCSYRLPLSKESLESSFVSTDHNSCMGVVDNLSTNGVGIIVNQSDAQHLDAGQILRGLSFDFDDVAYQLDLKLCNLRAGHDAQTVVGGKFIDLPVATQQQLQKSIMRVQSKRARVSHRLG
jgi:c-di-GMP-binding flagellar brake protein YcgR